MESFDRATATNRSTGLLLKFLNFPALQHEIQLVRYQYMTVKFSGQKRAKSAGGEDREKVCLKISFGEYLKKVEAGQNG